MPQFVKTFLGMVLLIQGVIAGAVASELKERYAPIATALNAELSSRPAWLFADDKCPADVMPSRRTRSEFIADACLPNGRQCLSSCKAGSGTACYTLAISLQRTETSEAASEALFLRACSLGIASGCTNRAAGLLTDSEDAAVAACVFRTFEKSCAWHDAWGCTMYGGELIKRSKTPQDLLKARKTLARTCPLTDSKDEACTAARSLIEKVDVALGKK